MIREDKNIKGISIGETEHEISQYTDDTEIMLEGDRNSFERTVKIIDILGAKTGLFLNAWKTSAILLGCRRNSPVRYMPHGTGIHPLDICHMEWNPPTFKVFGIC